MENISQMNSYFIIYSLILLMTCNTNPQDSTQSIAIGTEFEIIESHMNDLSDFIISSSELFLEEQFDYEISLLVRNLGWHKFWEHILIHRLIMLVLMMNIENYLINKYILQISNQL